MHKLVAILLLCVPAYAQSTQAGGFTITNIFDASGAATLTAPYRKLASDPATCDATKPEFYWNTTTLRVRFCESANVWSDVGSGAVNSGTGGYMTHYAVTGTSVSGLSRIRWNSATEKMEWYNSGGTKRAEMDVATGLPTFGIGQAGWTFNVGTAGGGTAKSGVVINGGDGANNTEPAFLGLRGSSGSILSYLFPCGVAGRVCPSATEPAADSSDYLASVGQAHTWTLPQIFTPSATLPAARLVCAALPSAPVNGSLACDSADLNKVKVYSNGAWRDAGTTSPAPEDGQYLTLSLNGALTAERVLTPGKWMAQTDGGANGNLTYNFRPNLRTLISVTDECMGGNISAGNVCDLGWNSANGTRAYKPGEVNHPGIFQLGSGATSGTISYMHLGPNSSGVTLPVGNLSTSVFSMQYAARVNTITEVAARIGVTSNATTATPGDGIYFQAVAGAGAVNWSAVTRAASVETVTDTGVVLGTDWHAFEIKGTGTAMEFYIDGGLVATNSTNVPTVITLPFLHVSNSETVSKTLDFDAFVFWMEVSR